MGAYCLMQKGICNVNCASLRSAARDSSGRLMTAVACVCFGCKYRRTFNSSRDAQLLKQDLLLGRFFEGGRILLPPSGGQLRFWAL
ncbi:hypothetical protein R69658_05849 [Paraburkholderia aspalathi]|uniref:Uncharacterized protein n=1 Tax=Paraburkholderia aspalathi TaxID=1324617 RepID=A0ABM8SN46_9BURK|nr:hypothetical protein R69658_05849 [Paraburkholderia aspalathi]